MKWVNKRSLFLSSLIIIVLTICGIGSFGSSSGLTEGTFDQEIKKNFRLNEFTEDFGQLQNSIDTFSIDTLPVGWNLTEMDLNFTNIVINPQVKTIEDSWNNGFHITGQSISSFKMVAIELIIDTPQYLEAVELYCYQTESLASNIFLQIQGCNDDLHRPNETIFGTPTELNISYSLGWHLQVFSSPIFLDPGSYFLVIDGRFMTYSSTVIHWLFNDNSGVEDPYSTGYWQEEPGNGYWCPSVQSRKFTHKLHVSFELKLWPEDINMGVEVAGQDFTVMNSLLMNPNHGRVSITDLSYLTTQEALRFNIFSDPSYSLTFDVGYRFKMSHTLFSTGYLHITESLPNYWVIQPNISQEGNNHTIYFEYADDWYNITVSRNSSDVTDENLFTNNSLTILNSSIDSVSEWKITANSPQHIGSIDTVDTSFETYDDITISLTMPLSAGELEIYFLNSSSVEVYRERRNITESTVTINPVFNSSQPSGIYTMYARYSNDTVGGLISFTFYVHNHPQSFWEKYSGFFYIGGTFVAISITLIVSSVAIKRY